MLASFNVVLLPDTQKAAESSPATLNAQLQWVADNAATQNIAFLSHVGDVVENGANSAEWQTADNALSILDGNPITQPDGVVPYSVGAGNHDFDNTSVHSGAQFFEELFGEERYAGKSWYGGSSYDQLNHFQLFQQEGQLYVHLTLEWEPRPNAVSWAQGVLDAYADVPTILTTHAYLDASGNRSTITETSDGLTGDQVFDSVVRTNPQIFLVLGGHFGGEAHATSLNDSGGEVFEVLANYQNRASVTDGWLQLLEFVTDQDRIDVTTYSPTLDQFETDANSQFSFGIDFDQRFSLSASPRVRLPLDDGPTDFNLSQHDVLLNDPQAAFDFHLLDFSSGINDATVTSSAINVTKNGIGLTEGVDYAVAYDASTDTVQLTPVGSLEFGNGTYEIGFNSNGSLIQDVSGLALSATTYSIVIDDAILAPPTSTYFALSEAATIGSVAAGPDDIVFYNGTDFSLYLDGSDIGLSGLAIDGFSVINENEVLLSFTEPTSLAGLPQTLDDSDIVRFTATEWGDNTAGVFDFYFDGSDVGLTKSNEDIDGISLASNGNLLITTKGDYDLPIGNGFDEDVLEFSPASLGTSTSGSWAMWIDGSDIGLGTKDINAVSLYGNTSDVYMSNTSGIVIGEAMPRDEDVYVFRGTAFGDNSAGTIDPAMHFLGNRHGLATNQITAVHIPPAVALPPNNPPVANDDSATVPEGGAVSLLDGGASNLLGNDTDPDLPNDTLSVNPTPVSGPSFGTLSLNVDGTFTYTHDGSENFSDSFVYVVQDAAGATDTATVTLAITPVNDAPTISSISSQTIQVNTSTGDLPFTIADAETPAGSLVVSAVSDNQTLVPNGNIVLGGTGANRTVQVNSAADEVGTALITVSVNDGTTITDTSFTVTVEAASSPPDTLYFSPVAAITLPGGVAAAPSDIVLFDGSVYSKYFDGVDVGLAASIDAIAVLDNDEILMSFTSTTTITGIGEVKDEDIVRFTATQLGDTTSGAFSVYFDGSDVGLSAEDVDAMDLLSNGNIVVSTTGSITVGGIPIDDEDLAEFTATSLGPVTSGTWSLYLDGSDIELAVEDVKGVSIDDNGHAYFSTSSSFNISGIPGKNEDVIEFVPTSLGDTTTGAYVTPMFYDGSLEGYTGDLRAIDVTGSTASQRSANVATAPIQSKTVQQEPDSHQLNDVATAYVGAELEASLSETQTQPAELQGSLLGRTVDYATAPDRKSDEFEKSFIASGSNFAMCRPSGKSFLATQYRHLAMNRFLSEIQDKTGLGIDSAANADNELTASIWSFGNRKSRMNGQPRHAAVDATFSLFSEAERRFNL